MRNRDGTPAHRPPVREASPPRVRRFGHALVVALQGRTRPGDRCGAVCAQGRCEAQWRRNGSRCGPGRLGRRWRTGLIVVAPRGGVAQRLANGVVVEPETGHSWEAATVIASVDGLIWKIWVSQEEKLEMGGIYLFADRETAKAYLNHPVVQAVCSNPAVVSSHSEFWDVESSLSALTRAPLPGVGERYSKPEVLVGGGE